MILSTPLAGASRFLIPLALVAAFTSLVFPVFQTETNIQILVWTQIPLLTLFLLIVATSIMQWQNYRGSAGADLMIGVLAHGGVGLLIWMLDGRAGEASGGFWGLLIACWLLAWVFVDRLASRDFENRNVQKLINIVIPVIFGAWLLIVWECMTRGLGVPRILLPPPSEIGVRFSGSTSILWADFKQTFLHAVLIGYAMGCGSGFAVAILADRVPFLRRGLLPIGNVVSALPIIGVAPIMVMWFGFDWHSKAAVVVIMTFFPMLVNTMTGLDCAGRMQRDLMQTYGASRWQTLFKLRLPEALPFIFNALKINSTLALIGAIVAEFFGTPTVGMGFRISTEVGRLNVDMVWAEIAVAALAGSLFYALVAFLEKVFTFWHPSIRG